MSEEPESIELRRLRAEREQIAKLGVELDFARKEITALRIRMVAQDQELLAGKDEIAEMKARLDRIERRLNLVE